MPCDPHDTSRDAAWLLDMWKAAQAAMSCVHGKSFEEYERDLLLRSAVERQIEIISEAARGISATFKAANTTLPRRAIIAQRHRLAQDYGEIDDRIIWTVATKHLPELVDKLTPIVDKPHPKT